MTRPSHLVLTSNREDEAGWLTEMLDSGWRLVSACNDTFYFENMAVITEETAKAIRRDCEANGPMRDLFETAADSGVERARREMRL